MTEEAADVRWEAVGTEDEWTVNEGRQITIGARRIAVFRTDDGWSALKDYCPHAGVPLYDGHVCDGQVACKAHGWKFHLKNGENDFGPGVRAYPVRVVHGTVEVGV